MTFQADIQKARTASHTALINMKNSIKQPNLLVITSYPESNSTHGKTTVGVASYAKNTLTAMTRAAVSRNEPLKIRVLAEKIDDSPTVYKEKNIEVRRVWKRNSFQSLFALIKEISMVYETKRVMIQFEVSMLGNPVYIAILPVLLAYLKLLGKEVTIVQHQVITDFDAIARHANIEKGGMHAQIATSALTLLYRSFNTFADKIIVFDTDLKTQLSTVISQEKIIIIPHGVEHSRVRISKKQARLKLGYTHNEIVILCFGYLAWYKGSDWITSVISKLPKHTHGKRIRLVLAGGANPNHADKEYNKSYIRSIEDSIKKSKAPIDCTGFIDELQIGIYFKACDITVFPYRYMMSASGPLAFALSYAKPFLVSTAMKSMLETPDLERLMAVRGITQETITFSLTKQSFLHSILSLTKQNRLMKKLSQLSNELGKERNFKYIGSTYYRELFITPFIPQTVLSWKQQNTGILANQSS